MKDLVKEGDVVGGPEGSALRGSAGDRTGTARLDLGEGRSQGPV